MKQKFLLLPLAALLCALFFFIPFSKASDKTPFVAAPPKNYKIIYDTDLQKLVTNVSESMKGGWEVAGGVAVYVQEGKTRYAQALVSK